MDAVDERHDGDQPRPPRAALDAAQPEHHRALVLLEDPDRQRRAREGDEHEHDDDCDGDHGEESSPTRAACRRLRDDAFGYRGGRRLGPEPPPRVVHPGESDALVCSAGRRSKSRHAADDRRRRAQDTVAPRSTPIVPSPLTNLKEIPVTRLFSLAALAVTGALVLAACGGSSTSSSSGSGSTPSYGAPRPPTASNSSAPASV